MMDEPRDMLDRADVKESRLAVIRHPVRPCLVLMRRDPRWLCAWLLPYADTGEGLARLTGVRPDVPAAPVTVLSDKPSPSHGGAPRRYLYRVHRVDPPSGWSPPPGCGWTWMSAASMAMDKATCGVNTDIIRLLSL